MQLLANHGSTTGSGSLADRAARCLRPVCTASRSSGNSAAGVSEPGPSASPQITAGRRQALLGMGAAIAGLLVGRSPALAEDYEVMEALKGKDYGKPRMRFPEYTLTSSGLQFEDLREGTGATPQPGQTCVIDWDGYTIGYYGRPFEARNKPKGSAFTGEEKDYYKFVLGDGKVIPGIEEAVSSMKEGGIRRIVVPVELGYPDNNFNKLGPSPSTFSGKRTLDFVLKNQGMIDKTLLYDIYLVKVK